MTKIKAPDLIEKLKARNWKPGTVVLCSLHQKTRPSIRPAYCARCQAALNRLMDVREWLARREELVHAGS